MSERVRREERAKAQTPEASARKPEPALLELQRSAGNQAVGRYLARTRTETVRGGRREARVRTRERTGERDQKYELNHPAEEEPEEQEDEETRFNRSYDEALARFGATAGKMDFSNTGERPHFDEEFWTCTLVVALKTGKTQRVRWSTKTDQGWKSILQQAEEVDFEYVLKSGVRPSTAVIALYERPKAWALDCIDFVVAARLFAECVAGGHTAFDRKYTNVGTEIKPARMRMAQHDTPKLTSAALWRREGQGQPFLVKPGDEPTEHAPGDHAAEAKLLDTLPIGTRVMWTTTHEEANEDFENENTIKVGPDRYAAHPLGVKNAASVRDEMVVEDDDKTLSKQERLAQEREHIYVSEIELYDRR